MGETRWIFPSCIDSVVLQENRKSLARNAFPPNAKKKLPRKNRTAKSAFIFLLKKEEREEEPGKGRKKVKKRILVCSGS